MLDKKFVCEFEDQVYDLFCKFLAEECIVECNPHVVWQDSPNKAKSTTLGNNQGILRCPSGWQVYAETWNSTHILPGQAWVSHDPNSNCKTSAGTLKRCPKRWTANSLRLDVPRRGFSSWGVSWISIDKAISIILYMQQTHNQSIRILEKHVVRMNCVK